MRYHEILWDRGSRNLGIYYIWKGVARDRKTWGTNLCKNCPAPRCPTVNWCNCDSRPVGGRFSWWIRALGSPPLCEQHCRRRRLPHRHPHRRPAASVPARFPIMCRNPVGKHVTTAPRTHTQQQETTTIPQSDGAGISFACSSKLIRYIVLRARIVTRRIRTRREKKCRRRHHHHRGRRDVRETRIRYRRYYYSNDNDNNMILCSIWHGRRRRRPAIGTTRTTLTIARATWWRCYII